MGRAPCSEDTEGLKKGAWTAEEDEKLVSFIRKNKGHGSWRTLPKLAGLERCGKSCRLRWTNYLRPHIKRGNFSAEEESSIIQLHAVMGNKWSSIASHLPGRTDNEVKNQWNTHLKKRLTKMGIDPTTHLPLQFITPHNQDAANYYALLNNHYQPSFHNFEDCRMAWLERSLQQMDPTALACQLAQYWQLARLQAEARMQIAASSHSYASWLQTLQQSQAAIPGDSEHHLILRSLNLQQLQATLTASNSTFTNTKAPHQASAYCEANDEQQLLRQLNARDNEENQHFATCRNIINQHGSTSGSGVPHASEGPVYTSTACGMATPESSTSESMSHELLCELPDLLSPYAEMSPILNIDDVPLSPLAEHDAHVVHDSYWNKMLNLLGPAPACTLDA